MSGKRGKSKEQVRRRRVERNLVENIGVLLSAKTLKATDGLSAFDVESDEAVSDIFAFGAFRGETEPMKLIMEDSAFESDRIDDAPIYPLFRKLEFQFRMMLQTLDGYVLEGDITTRTEKGAIKTLHTGHKALIVAVKSASKAFKSDIRSIDVSEETAIATHAESMEAVFRDLSTLTGQALALINKTRKRKRQSGYTEKKFREREMEGQAELWKAMWLQKSKFINKAIAKGWKTYEEQMRAEVVGKGPAFVAAGGEAWRVDYIGSTAKGYKGPPKQNMAFDPGSFDVDANLTAPTMAAWAIAQGSVPDRDRLWGLADTALLQLRQLKSFQESVHAELRPLPGYDLDEPFECVVEAEMTNDAELLEDCKKGILALKQLDPDLLDAFQGFSYDFDGNGPLRVRDLVDGDGVPIEAHAPELYALIAVFAGEHDVVL